MSAHWSLPLADLPALDSQRIEQLIEQRLHGDAGAMRDLALELCTFLEPALDRTRMLATLRATDAPREVMTRVLEKLSRDDAQALRQYRDWKSRHGKKTFRDWLLIVLTNAAREHVREQNGRRNVRTSEPSRKRLMNEYLALEEVPSLGVRPAITPQQTAREVVEYARAHLPAEQVDALERWLEGADADEIREAMSLPSADAAQRLVRAATATLRRHFAANGAGS